MPKETKDVKEKPTIKKSALAPTILVSGGAGFIGSHLIEALLLKDAKVVVIDNFSTGKRAYLSAVLDNPRFTLIESDINDGVPKNIEAVDYIFHLAGLESYIYGEKTVNLDSLLTNAVGTKNLLDLAKKASAKFLLVSSTDVYEGLVSSFDINHYFGKTDLDEKKYSHAEAKRYAEALTWEYYKKHKINARIVRLPEVYGPRMDFTSGGELGRLLKLVLDEKDLLVFGDGLEKSYFLHVADSVSGLVKAEFGDSTDGKIFTLAGNEPITTLELTYLLKGLSNRETEVQFKSSNQSMKPKDVRPSDISDSSKELRWSPKVELKEGIIKTLKWYNYEFNNNYFKPAKHIQEKKDERKANDRGNNLTEITSLKKEPEAENQKIQEPKTAFQFNPFKMLELKKEPQPVFPAVIKTQENAPIATTQKEPLKKGQSLIKLPIVGSFVSITLALLLFAIIPGIRVFLNAKEAYSNLASAEENIKEVNLDQAEQKALKASEGFAKAGEDLKDLKWVFLILRSGDQLTTLAKLFKIAEHGASALSNSAKGARPLAKIWAEIKPDSKESLSKEELTSSAESFLKAKEELARALAESSNLNSKLVPGRLRGKITKELDEVEKKEELLGVMATTSEALPEILGITKPKKYLILFQNPTELRATGGFIGSYATLTMEKGKIKEITIDDVYNPDGLLDLNQNKQPSYDPIKTYAKQEFLRIRDSNWQASFPDSAQTTLALFKEATNVSFDGVVAIDMHLVKDLLTATGPLFLTAYNEEITSNNVYEKAQYYSEALYTEGSQQKKAFLTVLGSKLLETLFSLRNDKLSQLAQTSYNNLEQKHILLSIPNTKASPLISERNWDGKVVETKTDYIYIVDSNVGSNKANFFVKESASYELKNAYRDGSLEANLTITYEHMGKDATWPGGIYTDYLRVLVPAESFLHKAIVKSSLSGKDEEKDVTKEVVVGSESGKRTFETALFVRPQEKLVVTFNYTLPSSISVGVGQDIYALYWQKQPGTEGTPISITFNEPFGKKVENPKDFKKNDQNYTYTGALINDIKTSLSFK
ncbi:MAG: NAD-dependent epimerase/dehydratase family protein [Patescibacteria group bacterium]